MKKIFKLIILSSLVFITTLGFADAFQQASDAYDQKQYPQAFAAFKKLALTGNPKAQYNLAYLYQNGVGTQQNLRQAIYWYRQAAIKKHINAIYNLAHLYQHSKPPIQNFKEAMVWYTKAAKLGSISALVNIGQMHFMGQGNKKNKKDYIEAYVWFNLAVARGSRNGLYNKDLVTVKIAPLDISKGETRYRERRPIYVTPFLK